MKINREIVDRALATNWKTTFVGMTLSLTGFVSFSPDTFGGDKAPIVKMCNYITCGGFAGLGLFAKDFNVVGRGKNYKPPEEQ